jgi:hypothetical protein
MEANSIATILAMLLVGLIGLSLLFWLGRLIWEIVTSPTAVAILISLLALLVGLVALQVPHPVDMCRACGPRPRTRLTHHRDVNPSSHLRDGNDVSKQGRD